MPDQNNAPSGDSSSDYRSRMASLGLDPVGPDNQADEPKLESGEVYEIITDPAAFVFRQLVEGVSYQEVTAKLTAVRGDEAEATALVSEIAQEVTRINRERRKRAIWKIAGGVVLGGIGVGVTLGTRALAGPGESYYVTFGLIIVGAISVIKGLAELAGD